ncbi:MAG: helix-turn-helix domain-containing protein [Oscillospiraceae bacterium]|nr:helix-turn-helix domain-containing protein [Oscillospiraceae bacterium]
MDRNAYGKRGYLNEDFRLFHIRDKNNKEISGHYHEFHKIVLFLAGNASYVIEGRRYILEPGDFVLVGRGQVHWPEFGSSGICERIVLYISSEFLRRYADDSFNPESCFDPDFSGGNVIRFSSPLSKRMQDKIVELESALNDENWPGKELLCSCMLMQFITQLFRYAGAEGTQEVLTELFDEKIAAVLKFINDNIDEPLTIAELADRFYISKYHMMRKFRDATGNSIHSYISDRRLMQARDLICSGVAATEACYKCGFRDYSAFARAYKKLFGTSPKGIGSLPLSSSFKD